MQELCSVPNASSVLRKWDLGVRVRKLALKTYSQMKSIEDLEEMYGSNWHTLNNLQRNNLEKN